jgi:hypothetical protein
MRTTIGVSLAVVLSGLVLIAQERPDETVLW